MNWIVVTGSPFEGAMRCYGMFECEADATDWACEVMAEYEDTNWWVVPVNDQQSVP